MKLLKFEAIMELLKSVAIETCSYYEAIETCLQNNNVFMIRFRNIFV